MRVVSREVVYNTMDKNHEPAAIIKPGETVEVQTQLCGGDWLKTVEDRWAPGKNKGPNLTTVVAVEGAEAGDTLAVKIVDVQPENVGYTGFAGWRTDLPGLVWPEAKEWGTVTHTVSIGDGVIDWSPELKIPVQAMVGTIGTAPLGEPQSNYFAYPNGGNMDVQEVCAGATVYLPVMVDGALLHIGDVHAIMGDGELPHGGGIECAGRVTIEVEIIKKSLCKEYVRLENDGYIMTVGCEIKMLDSFCGAARELMNWMCEDYGFTPQEAYLLFGQVLEARCTMLHGDYQPFSPYVCKINKKYLKPDPDFYWGE